MGWLRLGGSLKLQVSFAKEPNKRDCILPKRHVILRSLLIALTPHVHTCTMVSIWMQRATRLSIHIHGETVQHTALHRNTDTIYIHVYFYRHIYGVASTSRLLKIIGLFCKRALWKRRYSAKETYNFKEPTTRSHPIPDVMSHSFAEYSLFCRIQSLL